METCEKTVEDEHSPEQQELCELFGHQYIQRIEGKRVVTEICMNSRKGREKFGLE